MKRRRLVTAIPFLLGAPGASAGVMDWYNGVKIGVNLPEFDAEYIRPLPRHPHRLLLIDFWATWCAPCREEFPHLNALHAEFSQKGLAVLGLTKETSAKAQEFLSRVDVQYSIGAAGSKQLQSLLGVKAIPYAVLVNAAGKIIWKGQASNLKSSEVRRRLEGA